MEDHSSWLPSPDLTDEVNKLIDSTNRQTTLLQNQIYSAKSSLRAKECEYFSHNSIIYYRITITSCLLGKK